ncbi:hypothetical protein Acr_13g0000110 [Actinidia rufa]|uniref:Uncharacterized protein n=1 Tax=Actinidia rufa TaxID=165716 RepID=A0A7J0FIU5_9ERIC|nr:hypothetical protein Acr_13g0000110 [Actinidia rufa]
MKDLGRLVEGLSLIGKEVVKRSQPQNQNGGLGSLISSSLKKAILSATDLSGLTSGKIRELDNPSPNSNYSKEAEEKKLPQRSLHLSSKPPPPPSLPSPSADTRIEPDSSTYDGDDTTNITTTTPQSDGAPDNAAAKDGIMAVANDGVKEEATLDTIANRRRKPRERRVPSTPFSRALG